jgi:hypothetical protein
MRLNRPAIATWSVVIEYKLCRRRHNLYSIATNQAAIAGLFRRLNRYVGNLPPIRACFQIIRRLSSATSAVPNFKR